MITSFVSIWDTYKEKIQTVFESAHPDEYKDIIKTVVQMLHDNTDGFRKPDPERIHEIDDGYYQGTLVYVIGETGYQPSDYWYVKVYYGSCSGCDTLEGIKDCGKRKGKPSNDQVKQYMTLALHIIQNLRKMGPTV